MEVRPPIMTRVEMEFSKNRIPHSLMPPLIADRVAEKPLNTEVIVWLRAENAIGIVVPVMLKIKIAARIPRTTVIPMPTSFFKIDPAGFFALASGAGFAAAVAAGEAGSNIITFLSGVRKTT